MLYRTLLILCTAYPALADKLPPQQLFTINCSACHQLKIEQGGPALTEIAELYRGKKDAFVKWAQKPNQHKRKHLAQMPAMAHVPEKDLGKIYEHVMTVTKGLKHQAKKRSGDPFAAKLTKRPLVQRIFLAEASPAAIAVALEKEHSYVFDAALCRFRFLWKGGFLDGYPYWRGNGNGLAKPQGVIILKEDHSPLPFLESAKPKFLGYGMNQGLPTFRYQVGSITVSEHLTETEKGLQRTFTLTGAPSEITLTFPSVDGLTYSSTLGTWRDGKLTTSSMEPIVINYQFN